MTIPFVFLYKIFNDKPTVFFYAGILGAFLGGFAAIWGVIVEPILYYYEVWGWLGVAGGAIATVLLPIQVIAFPIVFFTKGGDPVHLGNFVAGLFFGLAGLCLQRSVLTRPLWSRFSSRKAK